MSRGSCGPIAVETKLGWVLSGPLSCCSTVEMPRKDLTTLLTGVTSQESNLDATLRSFWELESLILASQTLVYHSHLSRTTYRLSETDTKFSCHACIVQGQLTQEKHFPMWRRQFDLYLDDDKMWRCRGRLHHVNLPQSTRHPAMLPIDHHLTKLIVLNAHTRVHHSGTKDTLTEIRSRYWIVRGRSLVRMLIKRCVVCRRIEGGSHLTKQQTSSENCQTLMKPTIFGIKKMVVTKQQKAINH